MRHPNITPFWGITYNFDQPRMPCLVSPYYRHGNITSYIVQYSNANKWLLVSHVKLVVKTLTIVASACTNFLGVIAFAWLVHSAW